MESISDLFCLCFLCKPPSIIAWNAIFDVNRSSILSIVLSGNNCASCCMNGVMYRMDWEGVLSICLASPTTIISTTSFWK